MKIAVEITLDERAWWEAQRAKLGPFAEMSSTMINSSLADTLLAWAGEAPNAIETHVLKPGYRMEITSAERLPGGSRLVDVATNHEQRLEALETTVRMMREWLDDKAPGWNYGEHVRWCEAIERVDERLSELSERLPATE